MKITYLAHASFLITANAGTRIITDPCDHSVGYRMPEQVADIVTSSHDHFDHRAFEAVKGSFEKITASGTHNAKGITVKGIATAHDFAKLFNDVEYRKGAEIKLTIDGLPVPTSVIVLEHSC